MQIHLKWTQMIQDQIHLAWIFKTRILGFYQLKMIILYALKTSFLFFYFITLIVLKILLTTKLSWFLKFDSWTNLSKYSFWNLVCHHFGHVQLHCKHRILLYKWRNFYASGHHNIQFLIGRVRILSSLRLCIWSATRRGTRITESLWPVPCWGMPLCLV